MNTFDIDIEIHEAVSIDRDINMIIYAIREFANSLKMFRKYAKSLDGPGNS